MVLLNEHMSRARVFAILERADPGDKLAKWFNGFLMVLVMANIMAVIAESVPSIYAAYSIAFNAFEVFSVSVFTFEYVLRVWAIAEKAPQADMALRQRLRYMVSLYGLVDLLAILPSLLVVFMPGIDLRSLRAIRLLRILKFSHYSYALQDLGRAIFEERRAFIASFYVLGVVLVLASTLLHLVEHNVQPEYFGSIPDAMWWGVITLTTVGYGDVSPVTPLGKLLGGLVAILGVCTVALLTGILASSFSVQMARRKREFQAQVTAALSDGVLTDAELSFLTTLQDEMGISDEEFERLKLLMMQRKRSES
ncbi:MAG: ion transporter [Burkholderiaceae bacterium]|jgi:voltage-gated potassium channel|nr:MlotiK1 channel [Betaproteobacteria bacterium MOLA814]|tara:strand:+ start:203 stop:1129 length:927 start_codon:yes stop_codon:yes gene_type:complete